MSDTARRRGLSGRFSRSEPPVAEDPEVLEDHQTECGDENTPPRREDDIASPIPTPNTTQQELEERIDVQHQAQLAKITQQKQQLLQQIELAKANARVAQLEEQLHSISVPFQVREDTREAELIERVSKPNKEARGRLAAPARRVTDLQADLDRVTPQSPGDSQQASTGGSSKIAQVEHRKRHRNPSEDTSSENISKRRRYYGLKPKEPGIYTAKNRREHNEWLQDVENVFAIMHREYRHNTDKVAYAQQRLRGAHLATWNRYLKTSEKGVTFSEFCEVLLNKLQSPVLRTYSTVRRYLAAQQRKGQSVLSFVTYLDTLEGEMLPYTDDQRRMFLLCKLRPDLQQSILQRSEVPPTRGELITLARYLEDVKKMGDPT
jgi:predicted  nucleic acid-binding Zn-ribbon protein